MIPELIWLNYSPWSVRARWALDHHGIEHRRTTHTVMLGGPLLRVRTRELRRKLTVPLLFTDDTTLFDSYEIALWADGHGDASPLVPDHLAPAIRAWNERAQLLAAGGRARVTARTYGRPKALRENLPAWVPGPLRTPSVPVAKAGCHYLARKYGFDLQDTSAEEGAMRKVLDLATESLATREFLLDELSFADIILATSLQFVRPVDGWIPLGDLSRRCWTDEEIAADYPALLDWRDAFFASHALWEP